MALYFPNIGGRDLHGEKTNTTKLFTGRTTVLSITNTRLSEVRLSPSGTTFKREADTVKQEHTQSFVRPVLEDQKGKPGFSFVQVGLLHPWSRARAMTRCKSRVGVGTENRCILDQSPSEPSEIHARLAIHLVPPPRYPGNTLGNVYASPGRMVRGRRELFLLTFFENEGKEFHPLKMLGSTRCANLLVSRIRLLDSSFSLMLVVKSGGLDAVKRMKRRCRR